MDYLLVVQAPCARVSTGVFATESAFAEHLRILRKKLGARFDRIVVAAPEMTDAEYGALAGSLGRVDADADGIVFLPLHRTDVRARDFWLHEAAPIWRKLRRAAREFPTAGRQTRADPAIRCRCRTSPRPPCWAAP